MNILYLVPCFGIIALLYTMGKSAWVSKQDAGTDRMKEISKYISEGAMAFLRAEYKILAIYVVIAGLLLAVMGSSNPGSSWMIAIAFVIGAAASKLVTSLVNDIVNPTVGLFLPAGDLEKMSANITSVSGATSQFKYGDLVANIIDFAIIALIVFIAYKFLSKHNLVEDKSKPESK